MREYTVILDPDEEGKGYTVLVPALPGCITQGKTKQEALERAKEAIALYIESLKAAGGARASGAPSPRGAEGGRLAPRPGPAPRGAAVSGGGLFIRENAMDVGALGVGILALVVAVVAWLRGEMFGKELMKIKRHQFGGTLGPSLKIGWGHPDGEGKVRCDVSLNTLYPGPVRDVTLEVRSKRPQTSEVGNFAQEEAGRAPKSVEFQDVPEGTKYIVSFVDRKTGRKITTKDQNLEVRYGHMEPFVGE